MSEQVEALQAQIKEYEKQKKLSQEKLKEEHAQLVSFQKKLTQAGSHLKTLAQQNATLNKKVEEQSHQLEEQNTRLKEQEEEHTVILQQRQKGHEKEVKQLVEVLEKATATNEESPPDVSNSTLLDNYVKSVQKRLITKKPNTEEKIKQLTSELQELKLNSQSQVEVLEENLKEIAKDPENCIITTSLPPNLLLVLEDIRNTLQNQNDAIKNAATVSKSSVDDMAKDLKRQITQLNIKVNELNEEKEHLINEKEELIAQLGSSADTAKEMEQLKAELSETQAAKKASEDREKQLAQEHQGLLGKLSHFKDTLTPRLEAEKQLRQKVTQLSEQVESLTDELEKSRSDMVLREEDGNYQIEKLENTISQLQNRLERVQREREEYEVMAMQIDAQHSQTREQLQSVESELDKLKEKMDKEALENESEKASLANLQTVLEEFQATKDAEIHAAVEHVERQLAVAKKSWAEYQERATTAETALAQYQQDVGKTQQYEREIKEKNLLIGKLRHEAIILNEHLVEAMRKLKEETSENNVDRQLITNLLVGFFVAPRGDRKRFDILTIISNVLQLTDEQKAQIGLSRPIHHANSDPTSPESQAHKESFTDAWISFLLKESSPLRRNRSNISLPAQSVDDNDL